MGYPYPNYCLCAFGGPSYLKRFHCLKPEPSLVCRGDVPPEKRLWYIKGAVVGSVALLCFRVQGLGRRSSRSSRFSSNRKYPLSVFCVALTLGNLVFRACEGLQP